MACRINQLGLNNLDKWFPELASAAAASGSLRNCQTDWNPGVNLMIVDEVQDLTRLEAALATDFAKRLRSRNSDLQIIFAGDEGQTVRPTGFQFSWLNELIFTALGHPSRATLRSNLRNRGEIAKVVANADKLYRSLPKGVRPAQQFQPGPAEENDSEVHESNAFTAGRTEILDEIVSRVDAEVILSDPTSSPPKEPASRCVFAADVKGCEFSNVYVLDAASTLARIDRLKAQPFEQRLLIDNLRIAISRAVDKLHFVEFSTDSRPDALLADIRLGPRWTEPVKHTIDDQASQLVNQTFQLIDAASALEEQNPELALERLEHSRRLAFKLDDETLSKEIASRSFRVCIRAVCSERGGQSAVAGWWEKAKRYASVTQDSKTLMGMVDSVAAGLSSDAAPADAMTALSCLADCVGVEPKSLQILSISGKVEELVVRAEQAVHNPDLCGRLVQVAVETYAKLGVARAQNRLPQLREISVKAEVMEPRRSRRCPERAPSKPHGFTERTAPFARGNYGPRVPRYNAGPHRAWKRPAVLFWR